MTSPVSTNYLTLSRPSSKRPILRSAKLLRALLMPTLRTSPRTSFGPPARKRRCSCTTYSTQSTRHVVRRHDRRRAPPSDWLIASRKATSNPQAPRRVTAYRAQARFATSRQRVILPTLKISERKFPTGTGTAPPIFQSVGFRQGHGGEEVDGGHRGRDGQIESRRTRDVDACGCGQVGQDHQTTWHHSAVTDRKFPSSPCYLKKSLDRNTTGPSAWTGRSKNLPDARSSLASRIR